MGEKRVEVAKNVFIDKHIEAVSFPENNPWLKNVKSSCFNESETRYIKPVKVDLQTVFGSEEDGVLNLCDAPGYGDTAGPEIDIVNSIGIKNAINQCNTVKVIALLSSKGGDRGEGIRKLAHMLVNLIDNIEEKLKAILYVFTKYSNDYNAHGVLVNLKDSLKKNHPDLAKDSALMIVIKDMIKKTKKKTLVVDPINGDRKTIIKKIKKLTEIKYPDEVFKYALSEESNNAIKNQVQRDQTNIKCALKHQNSELALFYLNNLKLLQDLIEKDFLKQSYCDAVNFIIENLQNFSEEIKAKFNRAFHSQDGLKDEDIQEYKKAFDYIRDSQIFVDHLDSQLINPFIFIQNIIIEIQKIKEKLEDQPISNPLFGVYLDNLLAISSPLVQFQATYTKECEEFEKIINSLFQTIKELIKLNNFEEFAEKVIVLYNCLNVYKSHKFSENIEEKYILSIESLLAHLREFFNDPVFDKPKISKSDVSTLNKNIEFLKSAKESPVIQDRILLYSNLLKNKNPEA